MKFRCLILTFQLSTLFYFGVEDIFYLIFGNQSHFLLFFNQIYPYNNNFVLQLRKYEFVQFHEYESMEYNLRIFLSKKKKMMSQFIQNRFFMKKDNHLAYSKSKYELPNIEGSSLDIRHYQTRYTRSSFHKKSKPSHQLYEKSKSVKRNIPQQLSKQLRDKAKQNEMKMQRSIHRFIQKENYFNKTLLQKKKQKKYYGMENMQNQQINFFKSAARDNLLKQQVGDDDNLNKEVPLNILPNVCYDSPFMFQREGSCLTILNNKIYLFGGALRRKISYLPENSNQSNNDVLFHSYQDDRWVQEQISHQVLADKKNLIHHSVNSVGKKSIVIAGGMVGDSHKTLSKFNDSILHYNIQTKKFQQSPSSFKIRSHASASFENNVILHGGISAEEICCEMYILSVNLSNQASPIKVSRYQTNEVRVNHQIVTTLGEDKNFKINLRENNGIYMFGGEDGNGKMSGQLKIMKIYSASDLERKGIKNFEEIKTRGQGPCPRTHHSMNLISKKNSLVIIGGLDQKTNPLSDVWLIQLSHLSWHRIETSPNIDIFLGGIYKHATTCNNSSIFILGGRYLKDMCGKQNFMKLDFNIDTYDIVRTKQRKCSKLSSCWSIGQHLGQSDKLLYED